MSKNDFERVVRINAQQGRIERLESEKRDLIRALGEARRDLLTLSNDERELAPAIERIDRAIASANASDAKPSRKSRKQPTSAPRW